MTVFALAGTAPGSPTVPDVISLHNGSGGLIRARRDIHSQAP